MKYKHPWVELTYVAWIPTVILWVAFLYMFKLFFRIGRLAGCGELLTWHWSNICVIIEDK